MRYFIGGQQINLSNAEYFGGMTDGWSYEDLYRMPDGTWALHARHFAIPREPTFRSIPEDEAIDWLIAHRISRAQPPAPTQRTMQARTTVPNWLVPREEYFRCGQQIHSGPPPVGQMTELELPRGSIIAAT